MAPTKPCSRSMERTLPYVARIMSSELRRLRYVTSGLSQLETYTPSSNSRELNTSAIRMNDFVAESSNETPLERFLVWDPSGDPNVVYTRLAMAEAARRNAPAPPEPEEGNDAEKEETSDGDDDDDMGGIQIEGK